MRVHIVKAKNPQPKIGDIKVIRGIPHVRAFKRNRQGVLLSNSRGGLQTYWQPQPPENPMPALS